MKIPHTLILVFFCVSNLFAVDLQPVDGEPPVKVLVMAGQSNFGWKIRIDGMKKHAPEVLQWINSSDNDVLYSWKMHETGKGSSSDGFVRLDAAKGMFSQDHIIAYHFSKHWKQQNPKQRIAIIKVQKGATSLHQHWNPGGRKHWGDNYYKQGALYATLVAQIESGIAQLDKAGIPWEGAGFLWYQGEGDSYDAGPKYAQFFEDLVYGAELETGEGNHQAKGVLQLIKNKTAPVLPVRISWHLHTVVRENEPAVGIWGKKPRKEWEPHLAQVRDTLLAFSKKHNGRDDFWVNVDDLPLSDRFHYDQKEYIEIGHRMAKTFLE